MVLEQVTKFSGDVFIHMESMEYCTRGEKVTAQDTTVNLDNVVGYPVLYSGGKYKLAKAGDEANITQLIVKGDPIVALATTVDSPVKYQLLVHPPAIINSDKLPTEDYAGAAFNMATIITRLKALNYEIRDEPDNTTTASFND